MAENNTPLIRSLIEKITAMQIAVSVIGLALIAGLVWFIVDRGEVLAKNKDFMGNFVTFLVAIGLLAVILLVVLYVIFSNSDGGTSVVGRIIDIIAVITPMQMVASAIGILAFVSIIWVIVGGGGSFLTDSAKARGLITFCVAIVTVAIALILVFYVVFSTSEDLKERFTFGKDVLMVFVGILGTIMGFYYGADKVTPQDVSKIASAVQNPGTSSQPDEWVIVVGTDTSLEDAKTELEKALSVSKAAKIYRGGSQYRTIIPGFASREDALKILPDAQNKVNTTSFLLELKIWCKNQRDLGDFVDCQLAIGSDSKASN